MTAAGRSFRARRGTPLLGGAIVLCVAALAACVPPEPPRPAPVAPPAPAPVKPAPASIDPDPAAEARIMADVTYLASPELAGRGTGDDGARLAAQHVSKRFAELKLLPLGDAPAAGGQTASAEARSYLQAFEARMGADVEAPTLVVERAKKQERPDAVAVVTADGSATGAASGAAVLVGYGITAPALSWDDYAGRNFEGQIVVVLDGAPTLGGDARPADGLRDFRSVRYKLRTAREHKAAGVIVVAAGDELPAPPSDAGSMGIPGVVLSRSAARKLFPTAGFAAASKPAASAAAPAGKAAPKAAPPLAPADGPLPVTAAAPATVTAAAPAGTAVAQAPPPLAPADGPVPSAAAAPAAAPAGKAAPKAEAAPPLAPADGPVPSAAAPASAPPGKAPAAKAPIKPAASAPKVAAKAAPLTKKPAAPKPLQGVQVQVATRVTARNAQAWNVVGLLRARPESKHADEYVVIGAHYDHLGHGGMSTSRAPATKAIHPGADDNASGTALLLEVARRFAALPPPERNLVFAAFGAEEIGTIGSHYFVEHAPAPIQSAKPIVAMINADMVGRMRDDKLIVDGVGTAAEWKSIVQGASEGLGLNLQYGAEGFGASDHASFTAARVPVTFLFTGAHDDYHMPSDTADKVNAAGAARAAILAGRIALEVSRRDQRLAFVDAPAEQQKSTRGGFRASLGTIPDYAYQGPGLKVSGVRPDAPAARAGLRGGDVIVRVGTHQITNIHDYMFSLGELEPGREVEIEVDRNGLRVPLKVVPAPGR